MYRIVFTPLANADIKRLKKSSNENLIIKAKAIVNLLKDDPFKYPPSFEKLQKNLGGLYSRRISREHRIVYEVNKNEKIVKIISWYSHHERLK